MSEHAIAFEQLKERIIADPEVVLDDRDVMRALIAANEGALGANVVDLRGIALERLEARLDRLEDTHRSVISAAYENLAGTNLINRAVLAILEPLDFPAFLANLAENVAPILRVDRIRLVLETVQSQEETALASVSDVLAIVERGFVARYLDITGQPARQVFLRQIEPENDAVYGTASAWIRSEAAIRLDLGAGRLPGLLALGSEDPHQFKPTQGTDLLTFFGSAFERSMRRWLG